MDMYSKSLTPDTKNERPTLNGKVCIYLTKFLDQ